METLLRQKDCKSKHKILITKYLEEENRANKPEERGYNYGAKGSGLLGFPFPAVRATR
ncbi:MAG: hypothetical protein RL427_1252 [Bacteroidota bacterium]